MTSPQITFPYINTVEGFFLIFKRRMRGAYQHCGEKYLHRYLAEFEFRCNSRVALGINDVGRSCVEGHRRQETDLSNASSLRGPMGKKDEKQKRIPKIKLKRQSEQFKEAARELGADLASDVFDKIVGAMAQKKRIGKNKK
jgi:hypothetical protein